ncbi:MAG: PP2C family protein-serine/threonine phosphatase [Bacillus sp. (in: firmicutes)]
MSGNDGSHIEELYGEALKKYIQERTEQELYRGQLLSRQTIEHNISPEELISWHKKALLDVFPETRSEILDSLDFLLEVMMGYGIAYRETQSLRHLQQELNSEMEIAANVQSTLLETKIPELKELEIGSLSVPAKHMNGDFYQFLQDDETGSIGVAIADVIGKGIPAALCMSMIKYAMDSIPDKRHLPSKVLEALNEVVEKNVDTNMFITMFYGIYNPATSVFSYASAGHEPGLYYHAGSETFDDLYAKGLLLGVDKHASYKQYEQQVEIGDMIILMSDGVTECRTDDGFIEKDYLIDLIRQHIHLHPREIVINVYKHLEKLQHFKLRDDFTLIILKKIQ